MALSDIADFFSRDGFQPHGYCLMWEPGVFWTHVGSDIGIAASYFSIPAALIYLAAKRSDLVPPRMLIVFGAFIICCGFTHLFGIWTMWDPVYGTEALVKLVTAGVSVLAAVAVWQAVPVALTMPTVAQLTEKTTALEHEVAQRRRAEQALTDYQARLEAEVASRTADLTQANQALQMAVDAAEAASAAKSDFLARMSHELRTPLNAIIGFSNLMKEDATEALAEVRSTPSTETGPIDLEELLDQSTRINKAGNHLLDMITDILDLAKIEAGKVELVYQAVDALEVLREALAMAEPLAQRNGNAIALQVRTDPGAIETDVTRLKQIVFNLVSNACKFTRDGEITIVIDRRPMSRGDLMDLSVADTGIGMSEEQMARVFHDFVQADPSIHQRFGGTGLGLAITRRLATMMGGEVTVKSQEGVGSEFTLTVPTSRAPTLPMTLHAEHPDAVDVAPNGTLIIEDDSNARKLTARILSRAGIPSVIAGTGSEGMAMARRSKPRLILLDIVLPDVSGWDILAALKADEALQDIPVIVITAESDAERATALGAAGFIKKPFDDAKLIDIAARFGLPVEA